MWFLLQICHAKTKYKQYHKNFNCCKKILLSAEGLEKQ